MSTDSVTRPWICPSHPDAQILHTYDDDHYILNGEMVRAGIPNTKRNHKYQCSVCGMELVPFRLGARTMK